MSSVVERKRKREHKSNIHEDYVYGLHLLALNLKKKQKVLTTKLITAIIENKPVSANMMKQKNLPLIVVSQKRPLRAQSKCDTYTPTMIAAALGEAKILKQLIKVGVRLDRQQSWSGKNALLFALENQYDDLVCMMIANGASCMVHDRLI